MKIYISGKITGLPIEEATALFTAAKILLEKQSHEVINPMELPHNHDKSWANYMREDIAALVTCDAIFMLDNWFESAGAQIELQLAVDLSITHYFEGSLPEKFIL